MKRDNSSLPVWAALLCILLPLSVFGQQKKTWSIFVNAGAGVNDYVPMSQFESEFLTNPEIAAHPWIDKTPWKDNRQYKVVSTFDMGVSRYLSQRFRGSLLLGTQPLRQDDYHASVFYLDALAGYNLIKSERQELFIETGLGSYNTFNCFKYDWTGVNSSTGKPLEQLHVDLGRHDSFNWSIPLRCSYSHLISGRHWLGASVGAHILPAHSSYAPRLTASVELGWRIIMGRMHEVQKPEPIVIPHVDEGKDPCEEKLNRLNTVIDSLKRNSHDKDKLVNDLRQQLDATRQALRLCEETHVCIMTQNIFFNLNKSVITPQQAQTVKIIAGMLQSDPKLSVSIKGYASPEGNNQRNTILATGRAQAVADMLEKDYGISADRISCKGCGTTDTLFSVFELNRVATVSLYKSH